MSENADNPQLTEAVTAFERGDLAGAERHCRAALERSSDDPDALHLLGLIKARAGAFDEAIDLLRRAVADWDWPLGQFNLARTLAAAGRPHEAIAAFAEAISIEPTFADAYMNLGLLYHRLGDFARAAEAFEKLTQLRPQDRAAHNNLGLALVAIGENDRAEQAYRRAIAIDASYQPGHHNLATLLLTQMRIDEALAMAQRAVELNPADAGVYLGLGNIHRARDDRQAALKAYARAVELAPQWIEAHLSLAGVLAAFARFPEAISHCRAALAIRPDRGDAHRALALALEGSGDRQQAAAEYAEARRLDPSMAWVDFDIAALGGQSPPLPPAQYIRQLFDDYAPYFEEDLVKTLEYRAPQQIMEALGELRVLGPLDVLDLGCGTGLCGKLARPLARRITGVDLAPRMIEMSRRSGVYDELICDQALAALHRFTDAFDLVISADVFIYLGDLSEVFTAVHAALRTGGLFAFSIETHPGPEDFVLRPTRRYAQSAHYIRTLAAATGFDESLMRDVVLRKQANEPVAGNIFVLRKSKADQARMGENYPP